MKKIILLTIMALCTMTMTFAQSNDKPQAEIKFEKVIHDFGTFSESSPKVTCVFNFTNVGSLPLVINQATANCGCTVANYTKTPIKPGEKGMVTVTYNGKGKFSGHFKKAITIRSNGVPMLTRIYIEGVMTEVKEK